MPHRSVDSTFSVLQMSSFVGVHTVDPKGFAMEYGAACHPEGRALCLSLSLCRFVFAVMKFHPGAGQ